jgi:hypothetical protein
MVDPGTSRLNRTLLHSESGNRFFNLHQCRGDNTPRSTIAPIAPRPRAARQKETAAALALTRDEVLGFVYVKDVRVMTGVLRPIDETRWEVVCKVNGELYKSEVVDSRELGEQRLVQYKNALEATGWVESPGSS